MQYEERTEMHNIPDILHMDRNDETATDPCVVSVLNTDDFVNHIIIIIIIIILYYRLAKHINRYVTVVEYIVTLYTRV